MVCEVRTIIRGNYRYGSACSVMQEEKVVIIG